MQIELNPHSEPPKPPMPVENPYAPPRADVVVPRIDVAIWNPNATANWSLLFTPAFGAYLQALNWEALGEPDRARHSMIWFYVILGLLLLLIPLNLSGMLHGIVAFLMRSIDFWLLITWYFASGKSQAKYVKKRFGNDFTRRTWGKPLLFGFSLNVARFLIAFMVALGWGLLQR